MQTKTGFASQRPAPRGATAATGLTLAALLLGFPTLEAKAASAPLTCKIGTEKHCYKEVRIVNNTGGTIYIVIQGSQHLDAAAINCPTGGDLWLQGAFADTSQCYAVKNNYYIYVNPTKGIANGATVSITLPWWSKLNTKRDPAADTYVDWWQSARVFVFDDQTALKQSYNVNAGRQGKAVTLASGSPAPACNTALKGNACDSNDMRTYRVTTIPGSAIDLQTPYQLSEFTFADVLNQSNTAIVADLDANYNVSYVDQIYLPVAIAPLTSSGKVGYIGSVMSVSDWRTRLKTFTGANSSLTAATKWPIYNNPVTASKKRLYPNAGIRVPSAASAFNFYMDPTYIDAPKTQQPLLIAKSGITPPTLIANMQANWKNCTTSPYKNCPSHALYAPISASFNQNYKSFLANNCWNKTTGPSFLAPQSNGLPDINTYLFFLYGWAAFNNNGCTSPALPQANDPPSLYGNARVNYDTIQYNYAYPMLNSTGARMFNPYTQLIHGPTSKGFLGATAYAFSVDDLVSLQKRPANGLVFAIGGSKGLPSATMLPSSPPAAYNWYTASLNLGSAGPGKVGWKAYGLCSSTTNALFPSSTPGAIGLDPNITPSPCMITLTDTKNRQYQFTIKSFSASGTPPYQIWPAFTPSGTKTLDPNVVQCSSKDSWCKSAVETATKVTAGQAAPPTFTLATQPPLQN